jgi:hypothetical protein
VVSVVHFAPGPIDFNYIMILGQGSILTNRYSSLGTTLEVDVMIRDTRKH